MHQRIKSFVLRAGRISPRQQEGLNHCLPNYQLPQPVQAWDLETFFGRSAPTIVEIGFGMGDSLLAMAKQKPEINFIGVEVHRAGIGSLAASLQEEGMNNVGIAPYDAVDVFQTAIRDASLSGVQIFFPDPWPKKRHHKRRLIQSEFIHLLARKLCKDGFIHCATDWEDYAHHILAVLQAELLLDNQQNHGFSPRPEYRPKTKFEERGLRLGHGVWDIIFVRTN